MDLPSSGFSGAIDCLNAKTLSGICRDSIPGFIDTQLGQYDVQGRILGLGCRVRVQGEGLGVGV